ncbi:hypothetical protein ABMA27_015642 [Loxostege sticticalis]|uniref:Gag protein n=1 Tax=Loxostege sticticalis TaxID=481309 RepID=A0ABR3I8C9_LOXSC
MDNLEKDSAGGPQPPPPPVPGPSRTSRKRTRSTSSSSSASSSSSSSSSSGKRGKRSHRRRHKKSKRSRYSDRMINKLFDEMGEIRKQLATTTNNNEACDNLSIYSGVSGDLYEQQTSFTGEQCGDSEYQNSASGFTFDIETKLKEPTVPKTPDQYLKFLLDVQRFGNSSWSEVRYADTQKLYSHSPGFIDLETNDEVKMYDNLRHLAHTEKAYAAMTYCVLKQKETLQESIRNLLFWAKNTNVTFDNLNAKVEELFQKGDIHKISSDLLQLICGHRAESIEMRRESITSQVRDPLIKASLNRIPPTHTNLFDSEQFTSVLEKAGGVRKAFWPPKSNESTQQKGNASNRRPSRGQGVRKPTVPSRGTQYAFQESGFPMYEYTANHNPPSRGGYAQTSFPSRGQPSYHFNARGAFHNRGSRPEYRGNRGRSKATKDTSKRYKQ